MAWDMLHFYRNAWTTNIYIYQLITISKVLTSCAQHAQYNSSFVGIRYYCHYDYWKYVKCFKKSHMLNHWIHVYSILSTLIFFTIPLTVIACGKQYSACRCVHPYIAYLIDINLHFTSYQSDPAKNISGFIVIMKLCFLYLISACTYCEKHNM